MAEGFGEARHDMALLECVEATAEVARLRQRWWNSGVKCMTACTCPEHVDMAFILACAHLQSEPCVPGAPLRKGSKLRMLHVSTRKWLHSHLYQSPLSNNQEVRAAESCGSCRLPTRW